MRDPQRRCLNCHHVRDRHPDAKNGGKCLATLHTHDKRKRGCPCPGYRR